jgi:hypothetical protein
MKKVFFLGIFLAVLGFSPLPVQPFRTTQRAIYDTTSISLVCYPIYETNTYAGIRHGLTALRR